MRDNQFTPGARSALRLAREAAGQLGHGYIGSEHLLLGILQEGGCARGCLQEQAVTPEKIRSVLGELVGVGSPGLAPAQGLTPRARRIIETAAGESARRGGGAFLNGAPIHVSGKPLAEGIFGMGTAIYRREYLEPTMRVTEQLFRRACDFRRLGAAALDLCDVACGRVELFFEYSLCPWDFAAGSLIITEAGGHISTLQGGPLVLTERCSVWASNDVNKDILRELEI